MTQQYVLVSPVNRHHFFDLNIKIFEVSQSSENSELKLKYKSTVHTSFSIVIKQGATTNLAVLNCCEL